jgi:hypothetical protein
MSYTHRKKFSLIARQLHLTTFICRSFPQCPFYVHLSSPVALKFFTLFAGPLRLNSSGFGIRVNRVIPFLFIRVHLRGYEFCQRGALEHSGPVAGRTEASHRKDLLDAKTAGGLSGDARGFTWSDSPYPRMSTGAKHLHGDRPAYLSACQRLPRFSVRLPNHNRRHR